MKKILCVILIIALALVMVGCNKTVIDVKYHFNYAYVSLPDGSSVEGAVKAWDDYDDSDMMQVTFTDGRTFYTHASNIVLVSGG